MSLDASQWCQGPGIVRKRTFWPALWGLSEDQNRGVAKQSPQGVCDGHSGPTRAARRSLPDSTIKTDSKCESFAGGLAFLDADAQA